MARGLMSVSDKVTLASGLQMDNFLLDQKLGAGGMGEVWLAEDIDLQKKVAIKIISPKKSDDKLRIKRFRQEVEILTRLHHPSIVRVLQSGQFKGLPYMVMNYVEGYDLGYSMRQYEFSEKDVLEIGLEVCKAMEYAWEEHGILHRDIKPGNIMVDKDMNVFLMDLGISKSNYHDDPASVAQRGLLVGTPKYMSPEQACGDKLDFRADIYSTGAMMYRLVTGKAPFEGKDLNELLENIAMSPLIPVRQQNSTISIEFEQLLSIMLEKAATDRYSCWGNLIDDIKTVLNGQNPKCHKNLSDLLVSQADKSNELRKKVPVLKPALSAEERQMDKVANEIAHLRSLKNRPSKKSDDTENDVQQIVDESEETQVDKPVYKVEFKPKDRLRKPLFKSETTGLIIILSVVGIIILSVVYITIFYII